jgi:hypothetical protein
MPRINFTSASCVSLYTARLLTVLPRVIVPDSSPIITYAPAGAWGDSDAATGDYTNGTFHFTQTPVRPPLLL